MIKAGAQSTCVQNARAAVVSKLAAAAPYLRRFSIFTLKYTEMHRFFIFFTRKLKLHIWYQFRLTATLQIV